MNRLSPERRTQIVKCLIEGSSIRATCRITGADKGTVLRLLTNLGKACRVYHDEHVRNLDSKRIQVDELWAFCGMKARNVPAELKGKWGVGDVWTFTGIDPDSKLAASWLVAPRDARPAFLRLQFHADSQDAENHPGHGGRRDESALGS